MPSPRLTEDDLEQFHRNMGKVKVLNTPDELMQHFATMAKVGGKVKSIEGASPTKRGLDTREPSPSPKINRYAPYKSKLERAWANYLQGLVMLGTITGFYYEPLNLRLPGMKNFYKPDFLVIAGDGLTFYEVKGRNKSDDRSLVKIKTAAGITPWARFILVKRIGGQWEERKIS